MAQHHPPGMKMPSEDHMKKAMEDVTHERKWNAILKTENFFFRIS